VITHHTHARCTQDIKTDFANKKCFILVASNKSGHTLFPREPTVREIRMFKDVLYFGTSVKDIPKFDGLQINGKLPF
jgi:hypothetical protein